MSFPYTVVCSVAKEYAISRCDIALSFDAEGGVLCTELLLSSNGTIMYGYRRPSSATLRICPPLAAMWSKMYGGEKTTNAQTIRNVSFKALYYLCVRCLFCSGDLYRCVYWVKDFVTESPDSTSRSAQS